ncbi:hypothetical protein HDV01_002280 [Terramyces sp. JEL0728]|nr:hypothetical protein HDV01_002280 [Terramyces sp. JEL0728]
MLTPKNQEEYNEDFEEYSETSNHSELNRAMSRENDLALISQLKPKREATSNSTELPTHQMKDLKELQQSAQKEKNKLKLTDKQSKRQKDLSNLVQLDFVNYDLFDLNPMNEYELYIRSYGSQRTNQVNIQTNNDNQNTECQTDDWLVVDRWTQAPPHQLIETNTEYPQLPWLERPKSTEKHKVGKRLTGFLESAGQLVEAILLENETSEYKESVLNLNDDLLKNSIKFKSPEFINAPVSQILFLDSLSKLVCIVYSNVKTSLNQVKTVIALWRIGDPKVSKYLVCYPEIACIYNPPDLPSVIVGGSRDGSLQIWDYKNSETFLFENTTTIWPSAITDDLDDNHKLPIIDLLQYSCQRNSFRISSVDQGGIMQSWVVIIEKSKIEVVPSDRWKPPPLKLEFPTEHYVKSAKVLPSQTLLLGSDYETIYHYDKHQSKLFPHQFTLHTHDAVINTVTCLSTSPFKPTMFIAGYANGTIALFNSDIAASLATWEIENEIVDILWSVHRPALFYVIDTKGILYIYDLVDNFSDFTLDFQLFTTVKCFALADRERNSLGLGCVDGDAYFFELDSSLVESIADEIKEFDYLIPVE